MAKEILTNFIPISRRLFEHQLWCEERKFSRFEAWIYLLKEARFEDTKLYDDNKVVNVKRGQIYASIRFISEALNWSTKRTGNFIKLLEKDKMIAKETVKETGQTIITICNYDSYNNLSEKWKQQRKQDGNSKETKSNKENKDKEVFVLETWRTDFQIYLSEVSNAFNLLLNDSEFISEREKYHPNLDIPLSLEKAFKDYWATEKAWKKRKASKSEELNWKSTFKNALDQKFNQVYKQKGGNNGQSNNQISREGYNSGAKSANDKAASRADLENLADAILEQYSSPNNT